MPKKTFKHFEDKLKTLDAYSSLIPPLSVDAEKMLTENVREYGIRDAIVIDQNGIILDGHRRYKLAEEFDLTYKTKTLHIETVNAGVEWMIGNQLARRDLSKTQLAILALAYEPFYKELCKDRQRAGGKIKVSLNKGLRTSTLLAKRFKLGESLMTNILKIKAYGPKFIPLLKSEYKGITVKEVNFLCKAKEEKKLGELIDKGQLTKEAEIVLEKRRNTPKKTKTKAEREKEKEEKKRLADEEIERRVQEKLTQDKETSDNNNSLTEDEIKKKEFIRINSKAALEINNYINTVNKRVSAACKKGAFGGDVYFVDSELMAESGIKTALDYERDNEVEGCPNTIVVMSNKNLTDKRIQKASNISGYFCDSYIQAVRILLFGNDYKSFYKLFEKHGMILSAVKVEPEEEPKNKVA